MMSMCNETPVGAKNWAHQEDGPQNQWKERTDFYCAQITVPWRADAILDNTFEDDDKSISKQLKEKYAEKNGKYVHVPHKLKPPQVVAKRNARERRRVQAVNSAFITLRNAVPGNDNRGKRVSKVKTLQNAINYIKNLQRMLQVGKFSYFNNTAENQYYESNKLYEEMAIYQNDDKYELSNY